MLVPSQRGLVPLPVPGRARRSSISVTLPARRGDKGHALCLSASPLSFPFLAARVTSLLPHSQPGEEGLDWELHVSSEPLAF